MFKHRTYIEKSNDFERMAELVTGLISDGVDDWAVGRLYAWRYGRWGEKAQKDEEFEKQAELFFNNSDSLCGIVITENFGYEYYLLSLKDELLISEMLDFLAVGSLNKDHVVIVSEKDKTQRKVLAQKGYREFENADTTYNYVMTDVSYPQVSIPHNFLLTDQKEYTDEEAVERQRFFSFNPDAEYDEVIDRAYKYSRKNSLLKPELSIVLLNEEGKPVSSCMGYFDSVNHHMEVEVVCTLGAYENRGFAKVVISECIKRGIALGVNKFSISAWEEKTRRLYSSFGKPEIVQKMKYNKLVK